MMFEVGQSYKNNIGTYEVLAIHNNIMEVCYSDGHTQTLSVATQSRIHENRNRILTQSIRQNYTPKSPNLKEHIVYVYSDYWTLGFLLARLTHLQYKVQYDNQDKARDNYFDATGQELDTVKIGVFYYRKGAHQWSNQGVITFRASESELSLLKFNSKPYPVPSSSDMYEVSDINYFYFMLENGFRLGTHQDNDKIASLIPVANKGAFDKGYTFAENKIKITTKEVI